MLLSASRGTSPGTSPGTLRNGKIAEIRPESGFLGILSLSLVFLLSSPRLRRFRVFSTPPRWLLGVDVRHPKNVSRYPTERYGAVKMAVIRLESEILGISGHVLGFSAVVTPSAVCGGFAYLAPPLWVLSVDFHLPRRVFRKPTERYGAVKWRKYD